MKKKIILALTACLFAAGSIINMHLAQNNHNTDISLADISVMAQAVGEGGGNQATCYSTYAEALLFGTKIWVCGSCVQVKAKNWSDPGICYF